jgi:sugar/nucleoside kinase (ribokinase family)
MGHKGKLAQKLVKFYNKLISSPNEIPRCFVGFDGFTDTILLAVDKRTGNSYKPMKKMAQFSKRVADHAGKGCNIELVIQKVKLGGNAAIMTNALLEGGHRITFAGNIGTLDTVEPLFQEMAARCVKVYPLGPSGQSDAIEFQDGKIILGKLDNLSQLTVESTINHMGKKTLMNLLDDTDLFVCTNWTMLQMMTPFWKLIDEDLFAHMSLKPRWMFVDLADPAKRTDKDIREGLTALSKLEKGFRVILGLNEPEALKIGKILRIKTDNLSSLASDIRKKLGYFRVVIHSTKFALSADLDETVNVKGAYTPHPILNTGGGDNFNAGYCNALLYGLTAEETLLSGVATSGFYVRYGYSPTIKELAKFLKQWEKTSS